MSGTSNSSVSSSGAISMLTEAIKLTDPGWQVGAATLVNLDDALAADDWRPLVVQVEPPPVYALLTRQPANQRPSSSHYLECALVPGMPERTLRMTAWDRWWVLLIVIGAWGVAWGVRRRAGLV